MLLSGCIVLSLHVSAAQPSGGESPLLAEALELDVVVVTATRDSVRAGDVPYSISVVDRQTVERSGETALFQVLSKQVPGLFVTERSVAGYGISTGASGGLSIREWVRPHPGC